MSEGVDIVRTSQSLEHADEGDKHEKDTGHYEVERY